MKKTNILWISLNAPAQKSDKAGGNTFNYYFRHFYNDDRFWVKVIAQVNNNLPLMNLYDGDSYYLKREGGLRSKLRKLSSIESKYNPWNRNANLISNQMESFVIQKILQLKDKGFVPDVVILEWTQCVVLAGIVRKYFPDVYMVASEHDVTFVGYKRMAEYFSGLRRLLWKFKYTQERKVELNALKECNLILPQNWDNRRLLIQEGIAEKKIQWLVPYFNDMRGCRRSPDGKDILFFGAMARPENYLSAIWFMDNVMPLLEDMDIRFVVLGSNPPAELKKYESERVHITGFVDSITPFFENSVCLVAPLVLGAGIKVKILEALSSGIPVLTNDIGIEGIAAEHGKEYIHCNTPLDYERAIRKVFSDATVGDELAKNAKRFIEKNYSIEKSLADYKERLLRIGEQK